MLKSGSAVRAVVVMAAVLAAAFGPGAARALAAASVSVDPPSFSLPDAEVGSTATRVFTFTNTGDIPLFVYSYGGAQDASSTGGTCTSFPLVQVGASCTLEVTLRYTCRCVVIGAGINVAFVDDMTTRTTYVDAKVAFTRGGRGVVSHPVPSIPFPDTDLGTAVYPDIVHSWISLVNDGDVELNVRSMRSSNPDIQIGADSCTAPIDPSTSCMVNLAWTPYVSGVDASTITVETDGGTVTARAHGVGTLPFGLVTTDGPLEFGSAVVGSTVTRTGTLTNGGDAALTIPPPRILDPQFAVTGGSCPGMALLAPHASCTYDVTFTPAYGGVVDTGMVLQDNAPVASPTYPGFRLHATGINVNRSATITGFPSFGSSVGVPSVAQTFTLKNVGNVGITYSGISIGSPFAITGGTCSSPGVLAVGSSCTVKLVFTPPFVGTSYGQLSAVTSAGAVGLDVYGNGSVGVPDGVASPTNIDFGTVDVGSASAPRTVSIKSTGDAILQIWLVSVAPGLSVVGGTCAAGVGVLPGSSCTLVVTFTPTAAGPYSLRGGVDVADRRGGAIVFTGTGVGHSVDSDPPVVHCDAPDGAWHAGNVSIACTASDAGTGLAAAADASFSLTTNASDGSTDANAATGTRRICDVAGNCVTVGPIAGIRIDRQAPQISCGSADAVWHSADVAIPCTSTDGGSGLATSDASFTLTTTVADGAADADARTGSRVVCDLAGNCVTAGPVGGNHVDRKAPVLSVPMSVTVPATRPGGATVTFTATATDETDAAPVVACTPTSGATFRIGKTTVTCTATDHAGNTASGTFAVTVKGAGEQIADLVSELLAMLKRPDLSPAFKATLQNAADSVVAGRPTAACSLLGAFTTLVKATPATTLTVAQKAQLTADATRIRAVIGC